MIRPADKLEEAKALLAERPDVPPHLIAFADQLNAQGDDALRAYRQSTDSADQPNMLRIEGPEPVAFSLAAMWAMYERLSSPDGRMCEHMTDLRIKHIIDLGLGFVACEGCAVQIASECVSWSDDRCDVCGEVAPANVFMQMTMPLGSGLAFMDICTECSGFLGLKG